MAHYFRQGDTVHTITLGGSEPTVDGAGHTVEVIRREGGVLDLRVDGRPVRVFVAGKGPDRQIQVAGSPVQRVERVDSPRLKKSQRSGDSGSLIANTPAQVVSISVSVGDPVTRGQTLVILEAMKMEFKMTAPSDGVVKTIHCAVGEVVESGRELLSLETPEAE